MIAISTPASVRLALPGDEDSIMALLRAVHAEESPEPPDENKMRLTLRQMIDRDGGIVGVVRTKDGIEGTVGLGLNTFWYSSTQHLAKLWLFVPPQYRKSTHAKKMLEFSKMYADEVGVPLWYNEYRTETTEAKVKLVSRQLPEFGQLFLYNRRQVSIPDDPLAAVAT